MGVANWLLSTEIKWEPLAASRWGRKVRINSCPSRLSSLLLLSLANSPQNGELLVPMENCSDTPSGLPSSPSLPGRVQSRRPWHHNYHLHRLRNLIMRQRVRVRLPLLLPLLLLQLVARCNSSLKWVLLFLWTNCNVCWTRLVATYRRQSKRSFFDNVGLRFSTSNIEWRKIKTCCEYSIT